MTGVTPEGLLDLLGIDYIPRTNRLMFCCCFHHDTEPSAGFYLDTELAHCFSCSYTLDPTAFYARYKKIPWREAERELERLFGEKAARRTADPFVLAKRRTQGEARLADAKSIGMEKHAFLGEELDRLIHQFKNQRVTEAELDKYLEIWYNYILEAQSDHGFEPRRAPTVSPDGGVEEGVADISGLDGSTESLDLD